MDSIQVRMLNIQKWEEFIYGFIYYTIFSVKNYGFVHLIISKAQAQFPLRPTAEILISFDQS